MDWEKYVEDEREKQAKAMADLAKLFDDANIRLGDLPNIDLEAIEPEMRQELQMKFGLSLDGLVLHKPKTASSWRQRTKAIKV